MRARLPLALAAAALAGTTAPAQVTMPPIAATQGQLLLASLPAGSHDLTLDGAPVHIDPDGHYMAGISREFAGTKQLAWVMADGRRAEAELHVKPRDWDISRLPARLAIPANPTPEWLARRAAEVAQIRAARAAPSAHDFWRQGWAWPATGRVSTHFGAQRIYGETPESYHSGMDIAAPAGTPVLAPAAGVIALASGPFSLEGNLVILDHGRGLTSAMLHLSRIDVSVGQVVQQGDRIGTVGSTGRSTGPHLHWGLTWNGVRVDPEALLPPLPAAATAR